MTYAIGDIATVKTGWWRGKQVYIVSVWSGGFGLICRLTSSYDYDVFGPNELEPG